MTEPKPKTLYLKFLHTSDLQLGMVRWFLSPEAQARFDQSRLRVIDRLGELALEHGCAFIVVAGDVFEDNSLSPQVIGRVLERLKRIPVPVYLLPGNHDPLTINSVFAHTQDLPGVFVLDDSSPRLVPGLDGVEIIGAPLKTKRATSDLLAQALAPLEATSNIRVLVGHGQVESRSNDIQPDLISLDNLESRLQERVIDYVAMGDTHSCQAIGESGRVWFSGAPEVTDFHDLAAGEFGGEHNSGKALIVEIEKTANANGAGDPAHVSVEPVLVGQWRFEALHREVTSTEDVQEFLDTLAAYPQKDQTVIKYSLRGTLSMADTRLLEEGIAAFEPVFAALYVRKSRHELHLEPGESELNDLGLSGYSANALRELAQAAAGNPGAQDAINLLFRLAKEN